MSRSEVMRKLVVLVVLLLGCSDPPRDRFYRTDDPRTKCNGCEDLRHDDYVVTMAFKDHAGKEQTFSVKVDGEGREPDSVYQIRGIRPDGKEEYHYSQSSPSKKENGLLTVYDMKGSQIQVDFTSVEIRLLPCHESFIDEVSKRHRDECTKWREQKYECPRHGYRQSDGRCRGRPLM